MQTANCAGPLIGSTFQEDRTYDANGYLTMSTSSDFGRVVGTGDDRIQ